MCKKILMAHRGELPRSGAAPKPFVAMAYGMARPACTVGFDAEFTHV